MGIDWEYLLDAEGDDIQYVYDELCSDETYGEIDEDDYTPYIIPSDAHLTQIRQTGSSYDIDFDIDDINLDDYTLPFDI